MGWLDGLGRRAFRRWDHPDTADVAARANILAGAMEDERRSRDLPPPPVAGWRYQDGAWLRWSELDGAYRHAPVPMALTAFSHSLGTPREGMTVALVDGEWREVSDGAAPLREPPPEQPLHEQMGGVVPRALFDEPRLGPELRPQVPPPPPQISSASTTEAAQSPDPAADDAIAPELPAAQPERTMEQQLAAWRRRNAERGG